MNINFPLLLTLATLTTGFIWLLDRVCLGVLRKNKIARFRRATGGTIDVETLERAAKTPVAVEYARSFFPVLLMVLLIRSFVVEPFRIPSGSLVPTLLVGDFVVVSKFSYGLRLPVIHNKIAKFGEPKAGDIAVFRYPPNPSVNYIKRVIGLPGDHVRYVDKTLYVNGKEVEQKSLGYDIDREEGYTWTVMKKAEQLSGVKHEIFVRPDLPAESFDITVPQGKYFVMGDNRDNSSDSRAWGFVPEGNLIGKTVAIWFSWDSDRMSVRWGRIGHRMG